MASGYLIKNQKGNEIFWVRLGNINVGLESQSFVCPLKQLGSVLKDLKQTRQVIFYNASLKSAL